ncbi:MAG: Bax inhibitor-1/YccA family protein [Endomicrobia bacterium]|nr:Bax inhibitor-1/YccA family protein [Endomicrobiia bacterium]
MSNPLLKESVFEASSSAVSSGGSMTVSGTVNKSIILWAFFAAAAFFTWTHPQMFMPFVWPAIIGGFILAMICIFKKTACPFLSPVYAMAQGVALASISLIFEKSYPGIVLNAVLLTISVLICMLAAYKTGIIRATPMFKKVVILSTLAILLVYIADLLMTVFLGQGMRILSIHNSSWLAIGINLLIVVIAAFNLVIDFDLIESGARDGAPKYMEWYGAFALMVTLVWLYIEILRLLARMKN